MDKVRIHYFLSIKDELAEIIHNASKSYDSSPIFSDQRTHLAVDHVWHLRCNGPALRDLTMWIFFTFLLMFIAISQAGQNKSLSYNFPDALQAFLLGPMDGYGDNGFFDIQDSDSFYGW